MALLLRWGCVAANGSPERRDAVKHGRVFVKHVVPAVIKPARTLWNEVIGFIFICVRRDLRVQSGAAVPGLRRRRRRRAKGAALMRCRGGQRFCTLLMLISASRRSSRPAEFPVHETDADPPRRNPASFPTPAASTAKCTAAGSGRCGSTPASARPRRAIAVTAICCRRAPPDSR